MVEPPNRDSVTQSEGRAELGDPGTKEKARAGSWHKA